MKTARELAHAHCAKESTGGDWCAYSGKHLAERPHSYACDRLTGAIEADRRDLIEAALVAFGVCNHVDCPDVECSRVRSLSPKGTTPATKEVTRG